MSKKASVRLPEKKLRNQNFQVYRLRKKTRSKAILSKFRLGKLLTIKKKYLTLLVRSLYKLSRKVIQTVQ